MGLKAAVIPAHNEEKHIAAVIRETKNYADEVVVIDDGSTDSTYATAKKSGAIVLKNVINMGKGFALRSGVEFSIKEGADIIICLDADGQHSPKDIPKMLSILEKEKLDIVFGSRALDKGMPLIKRIGNFAIYLASNFLFGIHMKDTQTGFKIFRKEAFPLIKWRSNGYSVDSEIVMMVSRHRLKFREIPIKTLYNDSYKGTAVADGIKIVANMLWWRLER